MIEKREYKIYYNKGNINNCIIDVREIVDEDYIVYRKWSKTKKRYIYAIEYYYFFDLLFEKGNITKIEK